MSGEPPRSLLRPLSAEEIELWLSVASTVARRPGAILPDAGVESKTGAFVVPKKSSRPASSAMPSYVAKPKTSAPGHAVVLDRKLRQKLTRGRVGVDAAIDLHGLRQAEAHSALRHFLHRAHREGARIVLVVTGKGGRDTDPFDMAAGGVGVLKRSVPHWLGRSDLRAIVVGFEEAGRSHGGAGALYVRLRRRDKSRDLPPGPHPV